MKNNKFAIFYSWQSYIGGYANRVYIKDKIISAFKELNIYIELLEDSRGTTGAPAGALIGGFFGYISGRKVSETVYDVVTQKGMPIGGR